MVRTHSVSGAMGISEASDVAPAGVKRRWRLGGVVGGTEQCRPSRGVANAELVTDRLVTPPLRPQVTRPSERFTSQSGPRSRPDDNPALGEVAQDRMRIDPVLLSAGTCRHA